MGAHFNEVGPFAILMEIERLSHTIQDTINLPKVAELFWSHGDEERNHAIQFIQYLRMRGAENNDFFGGVPIQPRERAYNWSGVDEVWLQ